MIRKWFGISIAVALGAACLPAFASEATTDGFPPAQNFNYTHLPGADQAADGAAELLGASAYLFVAGSAFTPRDSSATVTYPGGGCSTISSLTVASGYLLTSLELPTNAVIQGLRLYYYSPVAGNRVRAGVATYTGDGGTTDLLFVTSTESTGYTSEYFPLATPATVDNANQSYALLGSTETGTRLCGIRLLYSP
ncbi:hypothetical protein [Dokdonella sp.]|uniref:hypothetical protein n=1 Tax=Dokdonella sp. TaxID=2291710 RepID=UPI003C4F5F36